MKRIAYFFLPLALALLGLSACKEDDNTVEEFPNWQARNETYFTQAYQQALTASVVACKSQSAHRLCGGESARDGHGNHRSALHRHGDGAPAGTSYSVDHLHKRKGFCADMADRDVQPHEQCTTKSEQ